MTIGGVLALGRAHAAARMTQTWRIGTLIEDTDSEGPNPTFDVVQVLDVVYSGPGRLKSVQATSVSEREPASQPIALSVLELHLPAGTVGVDVDMRAICDACPEDPAMVGKVVRIKGPGTRGQVTAARFPVEESGEVIVEGS